MQITNNDSFFNYFNTLINNKSQDHTALKTIFYPVENDNTSDFSKVGMEVLSALPYDLQGLTLDYANDSDHFNKMRLLCDRKVVHSQAVKLLKKIGLYGYADRIKMQVTFSSPEKYLWEYVFNEIKSKCNSQELEKIADLSSKERHRLHQTANKAKWIFEKFLSGIAGILNNTFVQLGIGVYVGLKVYQFSESAMSYLQIHLLPVVVNKVINIAPPTIIRIGNQIASIGIGIYRWRFGIILLCIGVKAFGDPRGRLGKVAKAIQYVIAIPSEIIAIPLNLAIKAYNKTTQSSNETAILLKNGADKSKVNRIKEALYIAQNMWVKQMTEGQ